MSDKAKLLIALMKGKSANVGGGPEPKADDSMASWTSCGSDLLSAIESKDAKKIGQVLQAASDLGGDEEDSETPKEEKSEDY